MRFKEHAIYQLPNGRELFALVSGKNEPTLYAISASYNGEYELNEEGRLLVNGKLTAWGLEDLIDTGRTAPSDVAAAVINGASPAVDLAYEQKAE